MSRARFSIFVYSIYLTVGGLAMALIPNAILGLIGHPTTNETWVRLFGALAFVLGAKGLNYSHLENAALFQFDVYTRSFFSTFLLALIFLGIAHPILMIWVIVDYGGSLWTQMAILSDRREKSRAVGEQQRNRLEHLPAA